jgi:hypothetical protein
MADSSEISIALTPVQLYAILNGKSISQGEQREALGKIVEIMSDPANPGRPRP